MSKVIYRIKGKNIIYRLIGGLAVRLMPVIGLLLLGWYLNKILEALLVLAAILQFEIAYRQIWLATRRDKPVISVHSFEMEGKVYLNIKNLGPTPAFLVQASALFKHGEPLFPREWGGIKLQTIEFLEPLSEHPLVAIDKDFYETFCREDYAIGISYFDRDGKLNHLIVHFAGGKPWVMPHKEEPPGFLTKIGDYIYRINTYRKSHILSRESNMIISECAMGTRDFCNQW